ncbi:hypothetical protein GCM10020331_078200 [Ectobacillus funiculus]
MFLLLVLLSVKILPLRWFELGGEKACGNYAISIAPIYCWINAIRTLSYTKKGGSLFVTAMISTLLIIIVAGHTGQYLAKRREKDVS